MKLFLVVLLAVVVLGFGSWLMEVLPVWFEGALWAGLFTVVPVWLVRKFL